jgi:hypothetical protein
MIRRTALLASLAIAQIGIFPGAFAAGLKVVSDQTHKGFAFPESVACDAQANVLYVSQFGSELKPTQKDGAGFISKVSLSGAMLEQRFLPASGDTLNKPKGIWVEGNKLWVTDIDVVWEFDLQTRRGKNVALPGVKFANDPTVRGNELFVSDNRGDQLYRVKPADFAATMDDPEVAVVFSGKSVNPNGVYPARDGSILMVGFRSADQARGIYSLSGGDPKMLSNELGRLDGVHELDDGSLLITDWNSGSLSRWSAAAGMETLATGFKGPADFCVLPDNGELLVAVPDLVKSELRIIRLAQ